MRKYLFALALLLVPAAHAQVARVFLSGVGNDLNDCSNAATPCRSLQGAHDQAPAGAEVIIIDSGGYGGATITKSITINAPTGVIAFVARTITINAGASDKVVLRGLTMNGAIFGDTNAIHFLVGNTLIVENSVIAGFQFGIVAPGAAPQIVVANTEFRKIQSNAIDLAPSGVVFGRATVENCRFLNVGGGVSALGFALIVIRDSVIAHATLAVSASSSVTAAATVDVERCVITSNATAFFGSGLNQGFGVIRVSDSTVVNNTTLVTTSGTGSVLSYSNNRLSSNGGGGFTGTVIRT
ncbi:MAG TPA: hypothetical protein VMU84_07840 [Thermoanaerobaculia bacterium]|nr:hypothetical protein [Thermoanaerobaculia bacterium]